MHEFVVTNLFIEIMNKKSLCQIAAKAFINRPPLWSRGNIVASHPAGPDSISGRVSFPGSDIFLGFSFNVGRTLAPSIPDIIGHHNKKKFIRAAMTFDVYAL